MFILKLKIDQFLLAYYSKIVYINKLEESRVNKNENGKVAKAKFGIWESRTKRLCAVHRLHIF